MDGIFLYSIFLKITAICSAGCETILSDNREDSRQHLLADPSDAMDYNVEMTSNSSKITAVLFVGISVDEVSFFSYVLHRAVHKNSFNKNGYRIFCKCSKALDFWIYFLYSGL